MTQTQRFKKIVGTDMGETCTARGVQTNYPPCGHELDSDSDHLPPSPSCDKDTGPKYEAMWSPGGCRGCLKWNYYNENICSAN